MWKEFKSALRFGAECGVGVVGVIAGLALVVFMTAFGVAAALSLIGLMK